MRFKLLLTGPLLLAGCFVQGAVTIVLMSGIASLLGGSESLVFKVLSGIWIVAMVALTIWFIYWLVFKFGRRIDQEVNSAERKDDSRAATWKGLLRALPRPSVDPAKTVARVAELDGRFAPSARRPRRRSSRGRSLGPESGDR